MSEKKNELYKYLMENSFDAPPTVREAPGWSVAPVARNTRTPLSTGIIAGAPGY